MSKQPAQRGVLDCSDTNECTLIKSMTPQTAVTAVRAKTCVSWTRAAILHADAADVWSRRVTKLLPRGELEPHCDQLCCQSPSSAQELLPYASMLFISQADQHANPQHPTHGENMAGDLKGFQ
ncbi:hypothetical protein MHYP_G00184980 [Metynnis hypsauchen]